MGPTPAALRDAAAIASAAALDAAAVEFLVTAAAAAAFSPRFASALQPVPAAAAFEDARTREVDIAALRAAFGTLPPSPAALDAVVAAALPAAARALLMDVLFCGGEGGGGGGGALRVRSAGGDGRRVRRFRVAGGGGGGGAGGFTAYHGSPVGNWWSILRRGLKVLADDPVHVATGRAYGDGVYLSERQDVAASFASVALARHAPDGWATAESVTGVFEVSDGGGGGGGGLVRRGARAGETELPEGYVVVGDESLLRLVELVVAVAPRRRPKRAGDGVGLGAGASWAAVLVFGYAVGLLLLGADASRVLDALRRLLVR